LREPSATTTAAARWKALQLVLAESKRTLSIPQRDDSTTSYLDGKRKSGEAPDLTTTIRELAFASLD
jgi:hypothetical protein